MHILNRENIQFENGNDGQLQLALNDYKNELFPPLCPVIKSQV